MEKHELFEKQYRDIFDSWPECVKFNGEVYELIPIAEKSGLDIFKHMKHRVNACWIMWNAKLEGCVVVPKDQIETWWQDAEEPENFATTIESIHTLGENIADTEIMEIDEHHTIHLPSKRIYGTWFEKDGERYFVTGSLEECRAMVEAARGVNHE